MIVITQIQDRLRRLKSIVSAKLTVANAPELYVEDVESLLLCYFTMRDSLARITQKMQQSKEGECEPIEPIKLRIDQQMNSLLSQRYAHRANPPILKPN